MTRSEITTQFTGLMNRRDLTANTALVSTFIDQAIQRVQRELRVPAMEKTVEVTIAADYDGLVIPSDLIELISLTPASTSRRLVKKDIDTVKQSALVTGCPTIYARDGSSWILGPEPIEDEVISVKYYAETTQLVESTDENIISIIAWDLIVYAALSYAADWFIDKRADKFEGRYAQILADLQDQADEDELGDDAAVQPALYFPPDDYGCE